MSMTRSTQGNQGETDNAHAVVCNLIHGDGFDCEEWKLMSITSHSN